jgi:hypothetical protein
VWAEVEPFMLLSRTGAVPSAARPIVPFSAAAAALAVPPPARETGSRPTLELVPGQGEPTGPRSAANLVLLPRLEVGS